MPIFFCEEHGAFGIGSKLCECLRKRLKEEREEVARAFAERATVLALFDEVKAVVDSGIVDSFEIALATVRMTLPEQVAVVALAVRKGIEISDLARWGLKE
jgi:hypothetical protein